MKSMSILHLMLDASETSMPYNEFALKQVRAKKVSIATFFASKVNTPSIRLYAGDNTILGFYTLLKDVFSNKKFDIIHVHSPHIALMLFIFQPFLGHLLRSTVYTVHNSFPSYKLRNKLLMIIPFRVYGRVIFCSHSSYDSFPWIYKYISRNRSQVVQNGIDLTRVDAVLNNQDKRVSYDTFSIISLGRLVEIKNHFTTLRAFYASSQNSKITFIGDGPLRETIVQKVENLGLIGKIHFAGLVSREEVYRFLSNADLFLSTSRGEGLPVAVLEAMACGCPVVLSDIPPHREIASEVDFIPLVSPDNVEGFANTISKFQQMRFDERTKIGEKCRKFVEKHFNLQKMLGEYENIYYELIDKTAK